MLSSINYGDRTPIGSALRALRQRLTSNDSIEKAPDQRLDINAAVAAGALPIEICRISGTCLFPVASTLAQALRIQLPRTVSSCL
jgi:hypothetical protein